MTQVENKPECSDLRKICQRVREKSASYDRYNFSSRFNDLLKAFLIWPRNMTHWTIFTVSVWPCPWR